MINKILVSMQSAKNSNILRSSEDRQKLAAQIQQETNYYNLHEIVSFVEEMRGLNLRREDDRQLFVSLLKCWLHVEDRS